MNNMIQKYGGNRKNKEEIHYYFIYMHINKINNKKYVGITYQNPPEKRWKNGKAYLKTSNPYFYNSIQKYGWESFEHIILEEGYFTVKEVSEKEDYYINFLIKKKDIIWLHVGIMVYLLMQLLLQKNG